MIDEVFIDSSRKKTRRVNTIRTGIDFAPGVMELLPTPASPSVPAALKFNTDHAWDMVVLAARASRYGDA